MQCEQILQKIREQVQRRRLMIYPYFKDHDRVCHLNSNKFTLFTIFSNFSANMAVYFFFFHFHFMHQRNLNVPLPHYYELNKMQKKKFYKSLWGSCFFNIYSHCEHFQWWFRSFFIYIYTSCIYSSSCIAFSGSGLHKSCDSHSVLPSSPLPEPECQPWRAEASAEEIPGPSQWWRQLPSLCTNCG